MQKQVWMGTIRNSTDRGGEREESTCIKHLLYSWLCVALVIFFFFNFYLFVFGCFGSSLLRVGFL